MVFGNVPAFGTINGGNVNDVINFRFDVRCKVKVRIPVVKHVFIQAALIGEVGTQLHCNAPITVFLCVVLGEARGPR